MLLTSGFGDGTFKQPTDENSFEFKAWSRCNDLVCLWILFSLDENIARSVMFRRSARDIWLYLEEDMVILRGTYL